MGSVFFYFFTKEITMAPRLQGLMLIKILERIWKDQENDWKTYEATQNGSRHLVRDGNCHIIPDNRPNVQRVERYPDPLGELDLTGLTVDAENMKELLKVWPLLCFATPNHPT